MAERAALLLGTAVAGGLSVASAIGTGTLAQRVTKIEQMLSALNLTEEQTAQLVAQAQQALADLRNTLTTLQSQANQLMQDFGMLQGLPPEVSQVMSTLASLNQAVLDIRSQLTQIEETQTRNSNDITTLKNEVATLQMQVLSLPQGLGGSTGGRRTT